MNDSQSSLINTSSLEEHLTNSIRRAKERIYNNAVSNYSIGSQFTISQLHQNTPHPQSRYRANSQRNNLSNSHHSKEEKSVLASAMRTLQQRISQLQRENKQLKLKNKEAQSFKEKGARKQQSQSAQLSELLANLRSRQGQIKNLGRDNKGLKQANTTLMERIQELQGQVSRLISYKINNEPTVKDQSSEQVSSSQLFERQQKIKELQSKLRDLQQKNAKSEETVMLLQAKLENEKKVNMRWIKMHEQQLGEGDHKQNNSLLMNEPNPMVNRNSRAKKGQVGELQKKNKQMYQLIQRSKAKIGDLTKQCKSYQERFNQIQNIAREIVQSVNKILPHQSSHLKYLATKLLKLENSHLQSLRSFSTHNRKNRLFQRNSHSKDSKERKKSLKMQDLNSSAKKSRERSQSKSNKKRKLNDQQVIKSEKKGHNCRQQQQIEQLQKQVMMLKKKYRNFIAKAESDKNNAEVAKKIDDTASEYNQKKAKLQQMKHNYSQAKARKDLIVKN